MIGINIPTTQNGGNTPAADGALNQPTNRSQNNPSAQVLNSPAENPPQNRVATPQQVAQAVGHNGQQQTGSDHDGDHGQDSSQGGLVDVRV